MKKRINLIFLITTITLCALIGCELYWVYINFVKARENFLAKATLTLKRSVDQYFLDQDLLPPSLKHVKSPTVTFMISEVIDGMPVAKKEPGTAPVYKMTFQSVRVDEYNLVQFKEMMARLISQQKERRLDLDTLEQTFERELAVNGIHEKFNLSIAGAEEKPRPDHIVARISYNNGPIQVWGKLASPNAFYIRTNLAPAAVSLVLILLSAGSLVYMRRIIQRHIQLDAMKSNFMNNIVHELRTPLTILRSSNEALSSFGAAGDQGSLERYLGINTLVIGELDANIDRILEISRSEQRRRKPVLEKVDLVAQVEKTRMRFAYIEDAKIELRSSQIPFEVTADIFLLEVILSNLIDNAIKYSAGPARISIYLDRDAVAWSIKVQDQGIGMESTELPYIFDKFYRVPTGDLHQAKGYGIGLSYVQQVVADLDGKISVASTVGVGSIFTVTFNS